MAGLRPGNVLGFIGLMYVFSLPCAIMAACFIAPFLGGATALVAALATAGWLSWCAVTAPGAEPDLSHTCTDRQGSHPC